MMDLFPHTIGFELVLLFERVAWGDILNSEIAKRIREVETESLTEMVNLAEKIKHEREVKRDVDIISTVEKAGDDFLNSL